MNEIVFFIGGSGTGKTTTESYLVKHGAKSMVSLATRDKREGEIQGVHYHFVTVEDFHKIEKVNEIVITEEWLYGIPKEELLSHLDDKMSIYSVINIQPAVDVINYIKSNDIPLEPIVVFFNVSKETRLNKMMERGESRESIEKRLSREDTLSDLVDLGIIPDYVVSEMYPEMQDDIKEFLDGRN
jgi:guanylate kinase